MITYQEIYDEAIEYAIKSIDKRIGLWDGVLKKIIKIKIINFLFYIPLFLRFSKLVAKEILI